MQHGLSLFVVDCQEHRGDGLMAAFLSTLADAAPSLRVQTL